MEYRHATVYFASGTGNSFLLRMPRKPGARFLCLPTCCRVISIPDRGGRIQHG